MKTLLLLGCSALFLVACGSPADSSATESDEEASSATTYTDIMDFAGIDVDGFVNGRNKLAGEFLSACGDAFCEGDFSNLTPLTLMCSVTSKAGSVHDCAWTFAGSLESVDPKTAAITTDAPTFQCHFKTKTTGAKLITFLNNDPNSLTSNLPGETTSIYDGLVDCFQHPIGASPISFPSDAAPSYVEASDYYVSAKSQAAWASAKQAAVNGFNNICGDTFCSSDYNDLTSMDFVCAITKSTGNVKECRWVFAGSFPGVDKNGNVTETSKSFSCEVPMKGTLSQLIAVWNAPGTDNVAQRPLPGVTTSAYDAIGTSCLP